MGLTLYPLSNENHDLVKKAASGHLTRGQNGHLYNGPTVLITTTALPTFWKGTYQAFQMMAKGSSGYSWSMTGTLPAGLGFTSDGILSGTPTSLTAGSALTFTCTGGDGQTDTKTLTLVCLTPPVYLKITSPTNSTTLGACYYNTGYSVTCVAADGTTPYYWWSTGRLPLGIALSSSGVLSGVPELGEDSGLFTFTINVSDASSHYASVQVTLPCYCPPAIYDPTPILPDGMEGAYYSAFVIAYGGQKPYTWSISSGSLPAGMYINSSTGEVYGTPSSGSHGSHSFTVRCTGSDTYYSDQPVTITIKPPLTITTSGTLPKGEVTLGYAKQFAATGGFTPLSWSINTGSVLPPGIALDGVSGMLSGTPTNGAIGANSFTIKCTDNVGNTTTLACSLTVVDALNITTASLPAATAGTAYSQTLASTGGQTPKTWTIISGALPTGLALNGSTGAITGAPTGASSSFAVECVDALGGTDVQALSITVNPAIVIPSGSTVPDVGVYNTTVYGFMFMANPTGAWFWRITSDPNNAFANSYLALNATTGLLTAASPMLLPFIGQTWTFTVGLSATSGGSILASKTLTIKIKNYAISVTPTTIPDGVANYFPYNLTLTASGGTAPYTFYTDSPLPPGLSFSAGGVLSGTPTTPGTYNLSIYVTDSAGNSNCCMFTFTIYAVPTISFNGVPGGRAFNAGRFPGNNQSPVTDNIPVSAYPAEAYTWTMTSWNGGTVTASLGSGSSPYLTVTYPAYFSGSHTYHATVQCKDASGHVIETVVFSVSNT